MAATERKWMARIAMRKMRDLDQSTVRRPSGKAGAGQCMSIFFLLTAFALLLPFALRAQMPEDRQGQQVVPDLPSVHGMVIRQQGNNIAIQTEEGVHYTVHYSENTRIYRDRQPLKPAEIHAGDALLAAGDLDDKAHLLRAVFIADVDAATVQKMRADLGKTWIAGKVTRIDLDNLKLTVLRMDKQTQVIAVDESTSFRKDGQSVTLRDLKVGDTVRGKGGVKDGIFVPTELNIVDAAHPGRHHAQAPSQ